MSEYQDLSQQIELIATAEESEQTHLLGEMVENGLDEGSIALILEAFPVEQRVRLWRSLPLEMHIDVLTEMRAEVRISVINALSEIELKLTLAKLDNLSLIEWEDSLPDDIISEALSLINRDELELYEPTSLQMTKLATGRIEKFIPSLLASVFAAPKSCWINITTTPLNIFTSSTKPKSSVA